MTWEVASQISVSQLFESTIVLRDLEPTDKSLPSIDDLRHTLNLNNGYIPRKNEPAYARVVESVVDALSGGKAKNILYVGDTVFTDGSVIKNLASGGRYNVLGFICNEIPDINQRRGEFLVGNAIFSDNWSRLWKLPRAGIERGFGLSSDTVVVFDMDQTVYAARGRSHEALQEARLRAVAKILGSALGPHRDYDEHRARRIYQNLDDESFHQITKDNQDFVVLFTLICLLGLQDPESIRELMIDEENSILPMLVMFRNQIRQMGDDLKTAQEIMDEVFHNVDALNDPTPFKSFREEEYLCTSEAMELNNEVKRIVITREVAELVHFLRSRGSKVIVFSDRPKEATNPSSPSPDNSSILDIEMQVAGDSIWEQLNSLT